MSSGSIMPLILAWHMAKDFRIPTSIKINKLELNNIQKSSKKILLNTNKINLSLFKSRPKSKSILISLKTKKERENETFKL